MSLDLKAHMSQSLERVLRLYVQDLEALDDVRLGQSLGGTARKPIDFTYEVAFVNRRIAKRLRGEDPGPFDADGWITAPDGFTGKAEAIAELSASVQEVLDAWDRVDEADLGREIETPGGPTNAFKVMMMAVTHTNYHDAQLNYVQSLLGDDEMHWD
ncbi:MAG: DinB family protein [Armatimonadetes bacterium]|nr:DinB family protein [Armatimonadota bacterium]